MKTKHIKYSMSALVILAIGLVGCSDNVIQKAVESATSSETSDTTQYTAGTIKYEDGTDFGVTRKEALNNGGFQIYSIGTGEVIGFIQVDGSVNDIGGNDLGMCQKNTTITDTGLQGDCIVPGLKPAGPQLENGSSLNLEDLPYPQPKDPNCPDLRNGDFDPSYSPAVCNANGYFWCSIAKACLDKPINAKECGEVSEREY